LAQVVSAVTILQQMILQVYCCIQFIPEAGSSGCFNSAADCRSQWNIKKMLLGIATLMYAIE